MIAIDLKQEGCILLASLGIGSRATGPARVHLILMHRVTVPVRLETITLTEPDGRFATQTYGVPINNGSSYFTRQDGNSWQAGTYALELAVTTTAGQAYSYMATVTVPAAGGESGSPSLPAAAMPRAVLGSNGSPATVGSS